jgi:hypothetical protein
MLPLKVGYGGNGPFVEKYRTLCITPGREMQQMFLGARAQTLLATTYPLKRKELAAFHVNLKIL